MNQDLACCISYIQLAIFAWQGARLFKKYQPTNCIFIFELKELILHSTTFATEMEVIDTDLLNVIGGGYTASDVLVVLRRDDRFEDGGNGG